MKTYLDCIPCFLRQTLDTARIITQDERRIRKVMDAVSLLLPKISLEASPPEIGREIYRLINKTIGVNDPYRSIKQKYIKIALSLYPELRRMIESSKDRLLTAIRLAIAGNVIDFAANPNFVLGREIGKIISQDFSIFHYNDFKRRLEQAGEILYLADNAGETVFDRLLIEEIKKPVKYVVRGSPVINDATREDAILSGIDRVAEVISSGSDAPGIVLKYCSREFLEIYRSADMIISKGQGNYEALSEESRPIFFLLKVKCPIIARDVGVDEGSIVLLNLKPQ